MGRLFVRNTVLLAAAAAAVALAVLAAAQTSQTPDCASKLTDCYRYLNSSGTPPSSCCSPLKGAAANETTCLCSILNDKSLLQQFGITTSEGFGLAERCGVATDLCSNSTAKSPSSSKTPTGGTSTKSAQVANWICLPGLTGLLFMWGAVMA